MGLKMMAMALRWTIDNKVSYNLDIMRYDSLETWVIKMSNFSLY